MVASGLPEKNGDLHAAEIANLAIALQSITPTIVVKTVKNPNQRLFKHRSSGALGVVVVVWDIVYMIRTGDSFAVLPPSPILLSDNIQNMRYENDPCNRCDSISAVTRPLCTLAQKSEKCSKTVKNVPRKGNILQVPHDPTRRLQIKMGIHTGATIAGVGQKTSQIFCLPLLALLNCMMMRYCRCHLEWINQAFTLL